MATQTPEQRLQTRFRKAITAGRLDLVQHHLAQGARANFRYSHDKVTALFLAAQQPSAEILQLLLQHGADPTVVSYDEALTPLHAAAVNSHRHHFGPLLAAGAALYARDSYNRTLLHCAGAGDHDTVFDVLASGTFDLEARNNDDETPLHYAILDGNLSGAAALIQAGADVHARTGEEQNTALHLAAWKDVQHVDVSRGQASQQQAGLTRLLLQAGADPNVRNQQGESPFAHACGFLVKDAAALAALVRVLMQYGGDMDAKCDNNETGWDVLRRVSSDYEVSMAENARLQGSLADPADSHSMSM